LEGRKWRRDRGRGAVKKERKRREEDKRE